MIDDSTHNPETDTFKYIRLVIESLNKMNRLDLAVDTIEQRLPVELFKVVEKSNNEVAQRHPSILRAYASRKTSKSKTGIYCGRFMLGSKPLPKATEPYTMWLRA
jgi:exocyst complex component 4